MKKIYLTLISIISVFGFAGIAFALPYYSQTQSMLPGQNDVYNIGTSSPGLLEYNNIFAKNITVSGTCTGCGGGAAFGYPFPSNATSTLINFSGGIDIGTLSGLIASNSGATYAAATSSLGVTGPITFSSTLGSQVGGAGGSFGCATCATFAYPWTTLTVNSTSTAATSTSIHTAGAYFASSTSATSTFAGNFEVIGNFQDDSVKSALLLDNSSGLAGSYGGTSCTNQFVRSLNAAGSASCATVANTDLANSSITFSATGLDVSGSPVALGGTLTVTAQVATGTVPTSGQLAYWGSAGTPSTLLSVATTSATCGSGITCTPFPIIGSTNPSFSLTNNILGGTYVLGNIWFDGTNITATGSAFTVGNIIATTTATSTLTGGTTIKSVLATGYHTPAIIFATSTAWTGTTTTDLPSPFVNDKIDNIQCWTNVGTLNVQLGTGSASTTLFNASSTQGTITYSSNNTFTKGQKRYMDVGTPASSPTQLTCTLKIEDTSY